MNSGDLLDPESGNSNQNMYAATVPNSTAVLVLGIISIVTCVFGFIFAIIAMVLHKKDKEVYQIHPMKYEASFKNSKAGYICAIIGLCFSLLLILFYVVYFIFIFTLFSRIH